MKRALSRAGTSKRKRKSSDRCSNIENEPIQEEKRIKEETNSHNEGENETNSDERLPLSELPLAHLTPETDRNDYENEFRSSSPESLVELSPCQSGFTSLNRSKKSDISPTSKLKQLSYNFETMFYCPTILRQVLINTSKKGGCQFVCQRPNNGQRKLGEMFVQHPGLQPRMRAVLLEWLIEVCDVFKLHRETYYLAADYIDRFLSLTSNIPKAKLQLIGISCLFIACKIEEIYPPKVAELAFVTDGACTEPDILAMELNVIKVLDWKFKRITCNCWLMIYLQLGYAQNNKKPGLEVLYPVYPTELYSATAQLLDLATLDIGSLDYNNSVMALSALFVVCSENFPIQVSGYTYEDIGKCVRWIGPFWSAILEKKKGEDPNYKPITRHPRRLVTDVSHFLQQHVVNLELLEIAQGNAERLLHPSPSSLNLLTPPSSSEKFHSSEH